MAGLISYRNLVDLSSTVITATGTVAPDFPLTNLRVRQLSTVTRISRVSLQTMQLEIFLDRGVGAPNIVGGVAAVIGINAVAGSPQPLALSVGSSTTASGYVGIGGTLSFVDAGVPALPQSIFCEITGTIQRYLRVAAQWFVGAGVTYGSIGRLWLGPAIVIDGGVDDQWELDYVDPGAIVSSSGGQVYERPKPRRRVLRCNLSSLKSKHAFGMTAGVSGGDVPSLQGLQMEAGLTGEVIVVPRSSSDLWNRRAAIYGHLDSSGRGSIVKNEGDNYSTSLIVIEER